MSETFAEQKATAHFAATPLPAAAETCLLALAKKAETLPSLRAELDIEYLLKVDQSYGLADARSRLGDLYPKLNSSQTMAVAQAYEAAYDDLPISHPRYAPLHAASDHDHEHSHDACDRIHGPLRKAFAKFEHRVLGRIDNHRARKIAAAAFRASALLFCPGDDIAALGLQLYAPFGSHTAEHSHRHEEPMAILPNRPYVVLEQNGLITKVPLDV